MAPLPSNNPSFFFALATLKYVGGFCLVLYIVAQKIKIKNKNKETLAEEFFSWG